MTLCRCSTSGVPTFDTVFFDVSLLRTSRDTQWGLGFRLEDFSIGLTLILLKRNFVRTVNKLFYKIFSSASVSMNILRFDNLILDT